MQSAWRLDYQIIDGGDVDGMLNALIIAAQLRLSGRRMVHATANGRPVE